MGRNEVDNKIQERLYNHNVAIDHDKLWDSIQTKKPNRYPLIVFLSSFLVLLVSLSFMMASSIDAPVEVKEIKADQVVIGELDSQQTNTTAEDQEDKSLETEKENLSSKALILTQKEEVNKQNEKKVKSYPSIPLKENTEQKKLEKTPKFIKTETHQITVPQQENSRRSSSTISKNILANVNEDQKTSSFIFSKLINNELSSLPIDARELSLTKKMIKRQTGCFDHRSRRNSIMLEVYGGPGIINKRMITSVSSYNNLLERRKASETSLESLRAGAVLRFNHHTGIYLKAGVEVSRLRERLDHKVGKDTTYTLENQIIDWEVDLNGDSIPIIGDKVITESSSKRWRIFNQFRTLDIPVLIGYEKRINKWGYYGEAGVILNVSMAKKGMILNEALTPSDLDPYFESSTGMHFTAGFGVSYRFTNRIYGFVSPNVKWSTKNVNKSEYPIDQKFHSYNILIGVGYDFYKGMKTL